MSGVLHYRALDERGEEILDELETRFEFRRIERMDDGERVYSVAAVGPVDLDPNLTAIDSAWEQHITRLTERMQETEKELEIPVPTKGEFDEALSKVAPPAGRKRPDGKDRRQKRSA